MCIKSGIAVFGDMNLIKYYDTANTASGWVRWRRTTRGHLQ